MRRRITLCAVSVLAMLMACGGNAVAAESAGNMNADVTDDDAIAEANAASNFVWNTGQSGTSIDIEASCVFDDNNNAVDFIFTMQLVCNLKDDLGYVIDVQFDTWENPNYDQPDNSANWPIGRYAYDTLSVSFSGLANGYSIECLLAVDVINFNPDPAVYSHDTAFMVIMII